MREKTAYVIEGTTIIVPTKDGPRQALERLMGMLWHATAPDSTEVYIHQDSANAFALGNRDAQIQPRMSTNDLPADVTAIYETGLRMGRLNIYEEPRIQCYERVAPKQGFAAKRLYMLSWMIKEHGKDLGRGEQSPIAQIQAAPNMHLCVHEDHLEEMAAYAEIRSARTGAVADRRLAHMLEDAVLARQSEADRKASKGLMASLRDLLQGSDGPEIPRRAA